MNTKQFQYVLTLAHEGSFSKAADTLDITQPSLSQYIKKIEQEVGLPLFDRTNGDVRITDAGRVYIETAKRILDLEHQMNSRFSELAEYKYGTLIIGAAPYRAAGMMPQIARRFQHLHPGMHLIVREGTTTELSEGMLRGEYDLAITLFPIDKRVFEYEIINEEELILAVPSSFPQIPSKILPDRKYPSVCVSSLDLHRVVMLTENQYMQIQLKDIVLDQNIDIKPAAVVKSLEAQIEMVKAGVGIALVPSGIERFCTSSEVSFYSFMEPLPKRKVAVMWRKDRELSKAAGELKEIIKTIKW